MWNTNDPPKRVYIISTAKPEAEGMSCEHGVSRIREALAEDDAALVGGDSSDKNIDVDLHEAGAYGVVEILPKLGFDARKL